MKKLIFSLLTICLTTLAIAQTNTFPTTGNTGIGTLSPTGILDIKNINLTYLKGLNINLTGTTGFWVDQTYGAYVVNNMGGSQSGPSRYGGYFEAKSYPSSGNNNYGLVGVANKIGGWGSEAIGVTGIGKHTYQYYATSNTKLIGVKGVVEFTDDGTTHTSNSFGASLYGEVTVPTNKTLTTYYGLYLKSPSGSITNKWGIFQVDLNSKNYLAGNVGIGTSSPGYKLDVNGRIHSNDRIYGDRLSAVGGIIDLDAASGNNFWRLYNGAATLYVSGTAGISQKAGKVGIGTTSPSGHLDIVGHTYHKGRIFFTDPSATDPSSGTEYAFFELNDVTKDLELNSYGSAWGTSVTFKKDGNVGIGTNSPTEKLAVDGTVLAKKVRVSTAGADWPDYVFAPNYELRALSELEQFVKENKHLPEVPSAKEVEEKGLDLGKMDAALLKKVEELTLYTIAQEKVLKKQVASYELLASSSKLQAASLKEFKIENSKMKSENQELRSLFLELKKEIQELKKDK